MFRRVILPEPAACLASKLGVGSSSSSILIGFFFFFFVGRFNTCNKEEVKSHELTDVF